MQLHIDNFVFGTLKLPQKDLEPLLNIMEHLLSYDYKHWLIRNLCMTSQHLQSKEGVIKHIFGGTLIKK